MEKGGREGRMKEREKREKRIGEREGERTRREGHCPWIQLDLKLVLSSLKLSVTVIAKRPFPVISLCWESAFAYFLFFESHLMVLGATPSLVLRSGFRKCSRDHAFCI